MKGIILSEFVEYLESEIGPLKTQQVINNSDLKSGGAYSRVEVYEYQEFLELLTHAAQISSIELGVLLQNYAHYLFTIFKRDYGVFFEGIDNAIDMLRQVDNHVHVEVKKLYPDAQLPVFEFTENGNKLHYHYRSQNPLAPMAKALIIACIDFFGGKEKLIVSDINDDHKSANFVIQTQLT